MAYFKSFSKIIFFCIFCISPLLLFSQIRVSVVDKTTSLPIPFSVVSVEGLLVGAMSDSVGIINLPCNWFSETDFIVCNFSSLGYLPNITKLCKKQSTITIQLIPQIINIEPVVIKGKRKNSNKILKSSIKKSQLLFNNSSNSVLYKLNAIYVKQQIEENCIKSLFNYSIKNSQSLISIYDGFSDTISFLKRNVCNSKFVDFPIVKNLVNIIDNPEHLFLYNPIHYTTHDTNSNDYHFGGDTLINGIRCSSIINKFVYDDKNFDVRYKSESVFFIDKESGILLAYNSRSVCYGSISESSIEYQTCLNIDYKLVEGVLYINDLSYDEFVLTRDKKDLSTHITISICD